MPFSAPAATHVAARAGIAPRALGRGEPANHNAAMRRIGPNLEASEVLELLYEQMKALPRAHRSALQGALILARKVPVADSPSEHVVAVASFGDKLLYWSDREEGWEIEPLDERGRIPTRGSNQFALDQALRQELGAPREAAGRRRAA